MDKFSDYIVVGGGASGCALTNKLLSANKSSASGNLLGDVLILANATSYAIYLILVKPLMLKYKPITVITHVFFFGFLKLLQFLRRKANHALMNLLKIRLQVLYD